MTRATLQQSGPLLFLLCDDIHIVTFALIKDQIKMGTLLSVHTGWMLCVGGARFRQMRSVKCEGDSGLKCLLTATVFGGAARHERYPGGQFDWLMEIDLCLILRQGEAGGTQTYTRSGESGFHHWSIMDQTPEEDMERGTKKPDSG